MKSRIGCPNMHIAGENLVSLSGVFLYCRIARWNWSVMSSPLGFCFACYQALDRLHTNFCSTVAVRVGHW